MINLVGSNQPEKAEDQWRGQLADFAKANQEELAALSWGLWLENQHNDSVIGIDMSPRPHFVYCPKAAIAQLNGKVNNKLAEMIGVVENFNPETEVLLVGIGNGQVKVIEFEIDPPPPVCFERMGHDVQTLIERLENRLQG
ncbi:beta-carboxysome assembly chaperone CcmS [Phormidium sp. CCY1219]|jgi:hypothetical protein|uniref:beta-carboxysome assembly chaperone CcmS n=1 Tax=Phormidium sp. CCY1219 TaxID=2886104 RepID=UPI002D1EED38|nr:hypothetical protein [Phormidium sp. CCY1219]MEB3826685.1 hypothetical protein [Phormidium sp. CCY1219]